MTELFELTNEGAPVAKKADPKAFRPIKSLKSDELMEEMANCLDVLIQVIRDVEPTALMNGVRDAKRVLSIYRGQLATITPAQFSAAWHKAGLPRLRTMSADRKRHLLARSKESFFVENWEPGLYIAACSDFCMGRNDRGWKANPDWFLRPGTLAKLMEGRYGMSAPQPVEPANMVTSEESLDDAVAQWKKDQDFFAQE